MIVSVSAWPCAAQSTQPLDYAVLGIIVELVIVLDFAFLTMRALFYAILGFNMLLTVARSRSLGSLTVVDFERVIEHF